MHINNVVKLDRYEFNRCLSLPFPFRIFFITSCFHKSPETGMADDLDYSVICHTTKGDYLITHEKIFQVTQWTTLVPHICFNPSDGIKIGPFKHAFKSGNPNFNYEWYGMEGNILVGIKMLFAFGIDVSTGKLLWKQQL